MTDSISRRAMVQGLAAAAGFLLAPGAVTEVLAQKNPKRKLYAQILNEAIASRDIRGAVERQRKFLDQRETAVFNSLTPDELAVLGSFRGRMARLGVLVAAQ